MVLLLHPFGTAVHVLSNHALALLNPAAVQWRFYSHLMQIWMPLNFFHQCSNAHLPAFIDSVLLLWKRMHRLLSLQLPHWYKKILPFP